MEVDMKWQWEAQVVKYYDNSYTAMHRRVIYLETTSKVFGLKKKHIKAFELIFNPNVYFAIRISIEYRFHRFEYRIEYRSRLIDIRNSSIKLYHIILNPGISHMSSVK